MAKFLSTAGVSYHLEELLKNTKVKLTLVSPYLQFPDRIKQHLHNLNIQKCDIRIVCRENKLEPNQQEWLKTQIGIRTSLCKNLHAKCYINENEAIITSMNLYKFSQENNNEMGILISKEQDVELYDETFKEVDRILKISEEIQIYAPNPPHFLSKTEQKKVETKKTLKETSKELNGFCIRTGTPIPFNMDMPMSQKALTSWSKYAQLNYSEKFCHFSGEESYGQTSFNKPILKKNWNKAAELFNLAKTNKS